MEIPDPGGRKEERKNEFNNITVILACLKEKC
jgi:hypothetical protein